jgi:hypothetical protein
MICRFFTFIAPRYTLVHIRGWRSLRRTLSLMGYREWWNGGLGGSAGRLLGPRSWWQLLKQVSIHI